MRFLIAILLVFFQLTANSLAQTGEDQELDSLISVYHGMSDDDTCKLSVCQQIGRLHFNVDSVGMWAQRLMDLAKRHKHYFYVNKSLGLFAWYYYYKNDYLKATEICMEGIPLCDSCGLDKEKAYHYYMLSGIKDAQSFIREAEQYGKMALEIFTQYKDTMYMIRQLWELEVIYSDMSAYNLAEQTLMKCMHLDSLQNNDEGIFSNFVYLGDIYVTKYKNSFNYSDISDIMRAKDFLYKAECMNTRYIDDEKVLIYNYVYSLFCESEYFQYTGRKFRQKSDSALLMCQRINDFASLQNYAEVNVYKSKCWAYYYLMNKDYGKALGIIDSLSAFSDGSSLELNLLYMNYYKSTGNKDSLLKYTERYAKSYIEKLSPADAVAVAQNYDRMEFDEVLEAKRKEHVAEVENEKLRRTRLWMLLGLVSLVAVFVGQSFVRKRRHLLEMNEKNKQITDSIYYAKNIQNASLPKDDYLAEMFGDYFLIYKPLNIVAGDFYWANMVGNYRVLVCADCTGHGVPGAFVSMLGISLLNEVVVNMTGELRASRILDLLRSKLMSALGQDKKLYERGQRINMDGMDLALVMIDYDNMKLQFAGAYRPLWIWRNGEIIILKPDKMPIGIYLGEHRHFTNREFEIQKGDVLYMFSDGIPDQFGYTDDTHTTCRHFSTKRLFDLLTKIGGKEISDQKTIIENSVDNWKNGYKQLDDNILIGVRV